MASGKRKVIPYRKKLRLNIGTMIFLILFIYLCFSAYSYSHRKHVRFYEVEAGGIVNDASYNGIILRTEEVQNAPDSGYVNYYIREGKRAAVGTRIYSLDETGNLTRYLEENSEGGAALSARNIRELKTQLSSYSMAYDPTEFGRVYSSRNSLDSALAEYSNLNALDQLDSVMEKNGIRYTRVTSPESGVVSFVIDGYEEKTPDRITEADFDRTAYKSSYIRAGDLAEIGKPVYKIIPEESWQVVFPLSKEDEERFRGRRSIRADFRSHDLSIVGSYSVVTGGDGNTYGVLTFDKFMVRFSGERFASFSLDTDNQSGLKIPKSAETTKNFYTVPVDYLTHGGNDVDSGFLKEVYEDGQLTARYTPAEIYYQTEEYYYLDSSPQSPFKAGDYLIKPDSDERYQIGPTAPLLGVYNINKGYAVFKQIEVIAENDEYDTVRRGTRYGLNVYDHILLNGEDAVEGEAIYQ